MKNKIYIEIAVFSMVCLSFCGCARTNRQPTTTTKPNDSVTYEKGRDFVGVIKALDLESKTITFYNTSFEEETTGVYSGGTQILAEKGKQISAESLEAGQVVDVYQDPDTKKFTKLKLTSDILEYDHIKGIVVNSDEAYIEINGVRYRYGSGFTVFSAGQQISVQEITKTDEVTFRGVKGKAYSLVVTKGHGYLKPAKYKDFVGGTLTVPGVMILPVTEKMLVPVPEGTYDVSMKNGDYVGSNTVTVERDKQVTLDMSKFKSLVPNTSQVIFQIAPVGAELYINGTLTDYSKPVSLKYGKHSVRVILEGYTTYAGVIDVQSANPTVKISLPNEEAEVVNDDDSTSVAKEDSSSSDNSSEGEFDNDHRITVSAPIGAGVYLDGTYKGTAPCSFPKKLGTVTITLTMSGFTTKSYTVTTTDDKKDVEWSFPDLNLIASE